MIENRTRVQIFAVLVSYFCNLSDFATLKFFSPIWEDVEEKRTSIWLNEKDEGVKYSSCFEGY